MFRNAKTGKITVGADNKVEQCTYVAAITRIEEELTNELTGGWKVIEVRYVPQIFIDLIMVFCFRWRGGVHGHTSKKSNTLASIYCIISLHDRLRNHHSLSDRADSFDEIPMGRALPFVLFRGTSE